MIIEDVLNIFESALYEISKQGAMFATKLTDEDFREILQFIKSVNEASSSMDIPIGLQTVNASLNLIRTGNAKDYLFGKTDRLKASRATKHDRADDEARISKWAAPERDRDVTEARAEQLEAVARGLENMGYINVDEEKERIRITDSDGLARIRNFLQISVDDARMKRATLDTVINNFDKLIAVYKNKSAEKFADREEPFEGASTAKMLTPNILIFLARVARNYSRKQRWDNYLNPANFAEKDAKATGFFEYDPHEAANDLESMGLAQKTDQGYRLNKEKIEQTVKNFRNIVVPRMKGAKIEAPTDKTGSLSQQEQQAKQFIEFMKTSFSDKVWANAQKHVFTRLREAGGAHEKALEWYLGARDNVTDEDNPKSTISAGLEKVNKTFVGTAIQFVTAKFLARRMDYEAARILGDRKKKPDNFITSRDIAPIARAYQKGFHKRPARI